jgi:putative ABC transport system permease protein
LAAAVTWYLMNAWLNNFVYHTSISFWMILVVGLCSLVMTLLTVSIRTIRAAMSNPVESIRME